MFLTLTIWINFSHLSLLICKCPPKQWGTCLSQSVMHLLNFLALCTWIKVSELLTCTLVNAAISIKKQCVSVLPFPFCFIASGSTEISTFSAFASVRLFHMSVTWLQSFVTVSIPSGLLHHPKWCFTNIKTHFFCCEFLRI